MVIQAGWGNTKSALLELADVGVDEEMRAKVREAAVNTLESTSSTTQQVTVRAVQGVKAGQNYLMDIELGVPGSWTVDQIRDVENLVRNDVGVNVRGVKKVRVRFVTNSAQEPDFLDEFIAGEPSEPEHSHDHDHEHDHDHDHNHTHDEQANAGLKRRK